MTIPENFAEDYEQARSCAVQKSGTVQQLRDWLRKARVARNKRREEQQYQAFLRRVDPAVLEDLGYEAQPNPGLITHAARMPPFVFLPGRKERQG